MKNNNLHNALDMIDDKYIDEAANAGYIKKQRILPAIIGIAACVAVTLVAGAVYQHNNPANTDTSLNSSTAAESVTENAMFSETDETNAVSGECENGNGPGKQLPENMYEESSNDIYFEGTSSENQMPEATVVPPVDGNGDGVIEAVSTPQGAVSEPNISTEDGIKTMVFDSDKSAISFINAMFPGGVNTQSSLLSGIDGNLYLTTVNADECNMLTFSGTENLLNGTEYYTVHCSFNGADTYFVYFENSSKIICIRIDGITAPAKIIEAAINALV